MFYLFTLLFILHSILIAKNEMRCKYTKLFREICSVVQISCVSWWNLQCIANFSCFWVKFAVYCKFLVFLGEICSVLQFSFCKTDNTFCKTDNLSIICISENLYLLVLLPETSYRFYCPKHPIVYVYISRCCGYHTDEIHAGEGCLLGVTCQTKHCRREEIRA